VDVVFVLTDRKSLDTNIRETIEKFTHLKEEPRVVSIGLIDRTPVHPREVFADALSDRASAIIVAHNHPAGSLEPSASDVEVTRQLKAAGIVTGIALLDHIIFNRSGYFSFLEAGRL